MTPARWRMLGDAERLPEYGYDGVAAAGPRLRTAEALEAIGYLRFAGMGEDDESRPRRVYEITDAGRAALSSRRTGGKR